LILKQPKYFYLPKPVTFRQQLLPSSNWKLSASSRYSRQWAYSRMWCR